MAKVESPQLRAVCALPSHASVSLWLKKMHWNLTGYKIYIYE